jgi:DNA-binding NtrC family response regulator
MPLPLQSKLLRFLQTKEFRRVGGSRQTRVDVRVVAATNRELEAEVTKGRFRQDLFYRINVFPIRLPPLRDRREDVPVLADHFLRDISKEMNRPVVGFTPEALAALAAHDWPGNVRQLENFVRRMLVMAEGPRIGMSECDFVLGGAAAPISPDRATQPFHQARADVVARFERAYLGGLLQAAGNNVAEAARRAGLDRKNLWLKLKRYGIARARS